MIHKRWHIGKRVQLYIEPRDAWIGAYVAPHAVFVCPLPFLVVKVRRG